MQPRLILPALLLLSQAALLHADDTAEGPALWHVRFLGATDRDNRSDEAPPATERIVDGRILVEAADGGVLLEDRSGRLWNITPGELISRERSETPFRPFSADELVSVLRTELGERIRIVTTDHYVIATSGNKVHAEWCGELLDRFLRAFLRYWEAAGLELSSPPAPFIVVVHGTRADFAAAVRDEGNVALVGAHGFYSMQTNRIVLLDITADARVSVRTRAELQKFVAADSSPISTIVHEATHQIAFNSGMHRRYADNPVWLTEGMAMYCEVPDLSNTVGWKMIGRLNRPRMHRFREFLKEGRPADSLTSLIADDERFRNPQTAEAAYAEAWAFTSYLLKSHRRQYIAYVNRCSENSHLIWKTRTERLEEFQQVFGVTPGDMERDFIRWMTLFR